eukprot:CAMPEP_0170485192 /NCGR_PEP_ID=MMETSP0208-20121228/4503_1 /TAXON_ID=197538 /ORGANISM="Strombidium inclinatum, Strain S3" /LENGTH=118 /DNA_ID=CAMNT_0010758761 /DNA_START=134 /DNA_END=490 /DNA_ORIENTATION=-
MKPLGIYGWVYGVPVPREMENMVANYYDPRPSSEVYYEGKNYQMLLAALDPKYGAGVMSTFSTDLVKNLYDSDLTRFMTYNFHLHHPAEFPIDGKHNDVGMHLVHIPIASDVKAGETI